MQNIVDLLKQKFNQVLLTSFAHREAIDPALLEAEVVVSSQPQFGHYQFNNCLRLGKALQKNPRELADAIGEALPQEDGSIAKLEITRPAFVKITLSDSFL